MTADKFTTGFPYNSKSLSAVSPEGAAPAGLYAGEGVLCGFPGFKQFLGFHDNSQTEVVSEGCVILTIPVIFRSFRILLYFFRLFEYNLPVDLTNFHV